MDLIDLYYHTSTDTWSIKIYKNDKKIILTMNDIILLCTDLCNIADFTQSKNMSSLQLVNKCGFIYEFEIISDDLLKIKIIENEDYYIEYYFRDKYKQYIMNTLEELIIG